MSVPKYGLVSDGAPGGLVPPEVRLDGTTELRVHGVGGSPPEALLNDLAPQQVAGDNIAGFYRTADYSSLPGMASRHVEGYSWGGLTSRSSWRVFWLLLLPFLLGNLAGWMCSARTKEQGTTAWGFRLHRASVNLACLALTINLVLVTAMMTADIAAYQVVRVGADQSRWWLAPLRWPGISGHPARQVLVGILAPVVVVLLLWVLTSRSQFRYERVQPPSEGATPHPRALTVAAALEDGLSDAGFWDGEHSVRHSSRRHIAASISFLGLMLAITTRVLVVAAGQATAAEWLWWAALLGSAMVLAFVVIRTCIDFAPAPASYKSARRFDAWSSVAVLAVAGAALCCAGIFAWLQPAVAAVAGQLPGMSGLFDWTLGFVAVILGLVLVSSAVGGRARGTLLWGPVVTTVVAFSLLNVTLFGLMLSVAHLLGKLTFAAAPPASRIYLPELVGFGTPALVAGALAAALLFALAELNMWWRAGRGNVKTTIEQQYAGDHAVTPSQLEADDLEVWKCSALDPPKSGRRRDDGKKWAASVARAQRIGSASRDAGWLFWVLAVFEIAAAVVTVTVQPAIAPDGWFGIAAITVATILPVLLVGLLRAGWSQQGRRRQIGKLWDVGTFWPRSYHPLAPPCYAERAVPELQRRLWWIHDNMGHVVIAAHSQGSVLAASALVQPKCLPQGIKTGLVTFGSPLGKLFSWGFPAYVNDDVLGKLLQNGAPGWKNYHYPTDPLGGPVFQQGGGPTVDVFLLDPAGYQYLYGQPPPAPGGHSGYWTDPRVWESIGKLAIDFPLPPPPLDPAAAPATQPVQAKGPVSQQPVRRALKRENPPADLTAQPVRTKWLGGLQRTVARRAVQLLFAVLVLAGLAIGVVAASHGLWLAAVPVLVAAGVAMIILAGQLALPRRRSRGGHRGSDRRRFKRGVRLKKKGDFDGALNVFGGLARQGRSRSLRAAAWLQVALISDEHRPANEAAQAWAQGFACYWPAGDTAELSSTELLVLSHISPSHSTSGRKIRAASGLPDDHFRKLMTDLAERSFIEAVSVNGITRYRIAAVGASSGPDK